MPKYKSVKLSKKNYDRLNKLKHPGQSMDGVVRELIDKVEKHDEG